MSDTETEAVRQELSKLVEEILIEKQKADALKNQAQHKDFEVQRLTRRAAKLASETVGEDTFDFLMRELLIKRP